MKKKFKPCRWFRPHKWKTIYTQGKSKVFDIVVNTHTPTQYEICSKCKSISYIIWDSCGGQRYYLSGESKQVVLDKLESGEIYTI